MCSLNDYVPYTNTCLTYEVPTNFLSNKYYPTSSCKISEPNIADILSALMSVFTLRYPQATLLQWDMEGACRGGSNTFNLLGIPNTFKYLYLTSNTKYFQSICIWPQILNTQSCQILFQILVKYFFEKKSIISFQKRANLPPFF